MRIDRLRGTTFMKTIIAFPVLRFFFLVILADKNIIIQNFLYQNIYIF